MNLVQQQASDWFLELQDQICNSVEKFDTVPMTTTEKDNPKWYQRFRTINNGSVFEKATVNFSRVEGEFDEKFAKEIPGAENNKNFWACGISVVFHPMNPYVPAMHFNTRLIVTEKTWYGGGFDFTPCILDDNYTALYHSKVKDMCNRHDKNYYPTFSKACDEYFYLPHRKETRGIGGIFFEYHDPAEMQFEFVKDVGREFLTLMNDAVDKYSKTPYTNEHKQIQNIKRGRYAEFNLLYDRGTRFGLKTGGDVDAILMSLPPIAEWR